MAEDRNLLPIRLVQPSRDFLKKEKGGGGEPKFFLPLSEVEAHSRKLIGQINAIDIDLHKNFEKYSGIPNIIKAKLNEKAFAKSHRPKDLFGKDTCPIVGLDQMGELLLSTTSTGIHKLKEKLEKQETIQIKANITAVDHIEAFGIKEKLFGLEPHQLEEYSKRGDETHLKVILFDHKDQEINRTTEEKFIDWVKRLGLKIEPVSNLKRVRIWKVIGATEEQIKEISQHPAVRTLSFFPTYKIVKPSMVARDRSIASFPRPEESQNYARIGIIDSGIPPDHPILAPWVIEHMNFVADRYANNNHGSFVGGIASLGYLLNGVSICPDEEPIKLVDVQVIENLDPLYGDTDEVTEDILMTRIEEAIPNLTSKHNVRIWNMSLGLDIQCEEERFSHLAVFLDELQEKYGIILTLPSGNADNNTGTHRTWPPDETIDYADRIEVPGDSVRSITVGAIACAEKPDSFVRINEPASYSCRGLGPSYTIKPDLVHYSGNISLRSGIVNCSGQGIESFDEDGRFTEDVGTSFSTPFVARTCSLIHNSLLPEPSSNLIKALTIHHSYLPRDLGSPEEILPYVGFGLPASLKNILSCNEHEITLIFEQEIFDGFTLDYPFSWPPSLIDEKGQCRGKVKLTLVAEPPLDPSFGAEYIRANVSASLQAENRGKSGKMDWKRQIAEIPETSDLNKCFEKELIEHGFKWKPIKRYEKELKRIKAVDWRLRISLLLRDGFELSTKSIKFAMVFSISDPEGKAPVYNEVVTGLRQRNVITNEIQLRSQIKQRVGTYVEK